jgi:uncharacterized Tic20 family protein
MHHLIKKERPMADEDQPQQPQEPEAGGEQPAEQAGADQQAVTPQTKDSTNLAMLAHVLGIIAGFIPPLIIWLLKKDEDAYIDDQAKEALNFQIMLLIVYAVLIVASCITFGLSTFLMPIVWLVSIVFMILAAVAASKGQQYRYPINLRLVK